MVHVLIVNYCYIRYFAGRGMDGPASSGGRGLLSVFSRCFFWKNYGHLSSMVMTSGLFIINGLVASL